MDVGPNWCNIKGSLILQMGQDKNTNTSLNTHKQVATDWLSHAVILLLGQKLSSINYHGNRCVIAFVKPIER